jgi:hypothetical protein
MTPLTRVRRARRKRETGEVEFRAAIVAAHTEGESLRAIARAAGVSHVRVLQIVRLVSLLTLTFLLLAPAASARNWPGLRMTGDVKVRHWHWATEAGANVPMPDARVWVFDGSPEYLPGEQIMIVPFYNAPGAAKEGWTAHAEKGLFLHELGHVYDYANMTPARRMAFKEAAGTSCAWLAKHCLSHRWVSGPDVMVDVAPVEMFAEMYAACALGLTERGYQDAAFNTYGWVPPDGTDAALCDTIRR